ncbi:hypothetical protein T06_7264 [Trichinella sp. T6]|nr:hypothetical protein T06_7264 [Trichinella sp. T6]
MKRSGALLNEVCSLAINHHKCAITDGKLGCSSGGKIHQMLKTKIPITSVSHQQHSVIMYKIIQCNIWKECIWQVVNYNSALQHHEKLIHQMLKTKEFYSKTIDLLDIGTFCNYRLRHLLIIDQLSFYGVPFALDTVLSHQISLSQSSSVRTHPDNVLVLVVVSAFGECKLIGLFLIQFVSYTEDIDWFCNLMFCNRISVKTEVSCLVTVKVKCPNCSLSDFPHRKSKNK